MKFSAQIGAFVAREKDRIDRTTQQVTILIAQGVILGTPVDTGRARANWQFSAGAPASGVVDATDKSGQDVLAAMIAAIGRTSAGGMTYISNNLPYINRLEFEGWSDQAPQGMVRVTLAQLPAQLDHLQANRK